MLGWVISCHDDKAQELLDRLEKNLDRCRSVGPSITGEAKAQICSVV